MPTPIPDATAIAATDATEASNRNATASATDPAPGAPSAVGPADGDGSAARSAPAQTPRYQEKREAILAAAARQFNEQGVRGATLAGIAGSVGLVTNSVTYYYRKKEDLATACFLRSIAAFDRLASDAAAEADVTDRLRAFLAAHARLLADMELGLRPPLLNFNDIRALPSPQAEQVFAAYTDMFRRVRALLQGPETAALARDDLNARAHLVLSVVHWVRVWIDRHEVDDYGRVAARVGDILLRGLAAFPVPDAWPATSPGLVGVLPRAPGGASEAFLRAATLLVNEQGYRGASVDRISARLNVTKGSFYHHNDTKHDLIVQCFDRSFAVVREVLREAERRPGAGWLRLSGLAQALVGFQLSDSGPLLRTTATSALPDSAQRAEVRRTMHRLTERLASVIVDGMMDGSVRPLDPGIAAQAVIASINAAAELQRWVPGAHLGNLDALYVRPMLAGVLCAPAAR